MAVPLFRMPAGTAVMDAERACERATTPALHARRSRVDAYLKKRRRGEGTQIPHGPQPPHIHKSSSYITMFYNAKSPYASIDCPSN